MTEQHYDAFAALAKKSDTKVLRIRKVGRVDGTGDAAAMLITLPLKELAQARPGTGQRHSLGFALSVDFVLPDGTACQLSAPWVSLTNR
jgi:hypothetical protein